MFIRIIDAKKIKKAFPLFKAICFFVMVMILGNVLTNAFFSNDEYVDAMILESERKTVIIDAGHGGEDSGTVGVNGRYEKDLNLEISFMLGEMLANEGFCVVYTRTEDRLLYTSEENIFGIRKISDLKNRCKIAAEYPEALFISIHMNSFSDARYSGLQVYYSENNENSQRLAQIIQDGVKSSLQPQNNRKIKSGKEIYVLKNVENTAVLIECGFLSNLNEAEKLSEKEYQKELCSSIVYGIIEYKGNK